MSQTVAELRALIEQYLTDAGVEFKPRGERLSVQRGSCAVFIKPVIWAETHTLVELLVPLLTQVDRSSAVLERLNDLNVGLYFGKAYWHDHTLWIAHNLLGDHLDRSELLAALGKISTVADKIDDELKAAFGGKLWIDS